MKVIFLDIDGVLIKYPDNELEFKKEFSSKEKISGLFVGFTKSCVKNFVKLVEDTDAYVVLSSSWRVSPVLTDYTYRKLKEYGIPKKKLIGTTAYGDFKDRDLEILEWINRWNAECEDGCHIRKWLVIDDSERDLQTIKNIGCLLRVKTQTGLRSSDVAKGTAILNGIL